MQLVLFTGIPAAGKSSFYRERFADTHVRINLDMLRTRHRERLLFAACLEAKAAVVVDNTNPTRADRARYIEAAKAAGFEVVGFYFRSVVAECVERNAARSDAQRIREGGITHAATRLERPEPSEGFDQLFYVRLSDDGFLVEDWSGQIRVGDRGPDSR
jgi:predicted kinase